MKRRGEAVTLIVVIIAALGIGGAAYYYYSQSGKKPSGGMQTSEDKRLEQEARKVEALVHDIDEELSSKFGEFYPQALESYDLVLREKAKWGDRTVLEARDKAAFVLNEEFVQKFRSLAKSGSLEIAEDGSGFSIDVNDGKSFDVEETLRGLLHQVSGLKAGVPSRYIDQKDLEKYLAGRIQEKSVDAYGYVRLIFKTDIDDVYVVAVFSIDLNEAKHSKGRYIATGRDLLISRTSDKFVDGVKDQMRFNQDFYILEFDLNTPNAIDSNSTAEECIRKFINQFRK